MYNLKHLVGIARSGFADMTPALQRAFNRDTADDRLDRLFGPAPRAAIAVSIVVAMVAGSGLEAWLAGGIVAKHVNFSAVLIGVMYAFLVRRYLFVSGEAREADFPWLAAPLIPAAAALVAVSFFATVFTGGVEVLEDAPAWTSIGGVLAAVADAFAVAAGLTIAVAALCFSKNWGEAFKDLFEKLLVFKITVFVMVLLIVEVGIAGPILGSVMESVFGIRFPSWLPDFVDQVTYAALMTTIYVAVIGAAWTACRQSFGELLETGHANILKTIEEMGETAQEREKRLRKEQRKSERREKRQSRRSRRRS